MAATKVLLLGGHGKIAMHLTPLLLAKRWNVTSVVRNPDHEAEILELGSGQPGQLNVLVNSLDEVKSDADASRVLNQVDPDIVVFSAGAGGKGGASRTKAVDEIAAKAYIGSALARSKVKKFLMVSYIASRHGRPPWWNDEDWAAAQKVNTEILPAYFKAKVEADEYLVALAHKRQRDGDKSFQMINLRPGTLTEDPAGGVLLGKTPARGKSSREAVAQVASALLERSDTHGYFHMLDGDDKIEDAVDKLVKGDHDGLKGEDLEKIYARI